jgi:tRNA(Ser,Leu) C12 N-acetylase TAN1
MNDRIENKCTFLILRLNTKEKESLKVLAKQRGITLTKLVLSCLSNKSVPDYRARLKLLDGVAIIVKEMNAIGNNINQVTTAIHQIKLSRKMPVNEYELIMEYIIKYQAKEQEIKLLIQQLLNEQFSF